MKKPNNVSIRFLIFLSVCLSLFSCDKDDFPKDYVGFKDSKQTVECDRNKAEDRLEVKIIAMKKSKKDRTVLLTSPSPATGQAAIMQLTEKQVIVKAGKTSATTTVKIYPKQMVLKEQNVILTCTPQWKEGGISKLTILLKQK